VIGASYYTFESEARELMGDGENFLDSRARKKRERASGEVRSRGEKTAIGMRD